MLLARPETLRRPVEGRLVSLGTHGSQCPEHHASLSLLRGDFRSQIVMNRMCVRRAAGSQMHDNGAESFKSVGPPHET